MSAIEVVPVRGLSRTGLRLPEGMEFEEWLKVGEQLTRYESATNWAIGDWLFFGEWQYGKRYEEALELTGLSYGTLANLKYVAGRFGFSRRRENLSLAHHQNVAALPPAEADQWLDRAERGSWPHARLRDEVASSFAAAGSRARGERLAKKASADPTPVADVTTVTVQLDTDRAGRWTVAADARNMALSAWVVTVCDEASDPETVAGVG